MNNSLITEKEFLMKKEALYGALFTTSNGYLGVRGSFEENATLAVQGCFIRGLIDEIPFNQTVSIENEYMRKYYVNEDAAKDAEFQEGVINFADILHIRISVDGEVFYPWDGRILSWNRTLDIERNRLIRQVIWENSKGDITEFKFERFASFANDHLYVINVSVTPQNHNKEIKISSGLDLRTKSNGFKMCTLDEVNFENNSIFCSLSTKGKYNHKISIGVSNSFDSSDENTNSGGFLTQAKAYVSKCGEAYNFTKKIFMCTSRDTDGESIDGLFEKYAAIPYADLLDEHTKSWSSFFSRIDIKIEGDDQADTVLRFSNYHTAISIPRNDCVHSLAAKNLTGEGYNDYVWWDCEVYQSPVFIYSGADCAKNMLMYRYNRLDAAREIAKSEGRRGARYPFISSVTGEEKVWKHVRHPFMQYHVVADVAWNVLNYFYCTGDKEFMQSYGMEMLSEICDYWVSRVEEINGRYEITKVTGCDEHHPYVDNNAYTNYLVHYILESTVVLCKQFEKPISDEWTEVMERLYLPMDKSGLIPQFDGYFNLSRTLECEGSGGGGFQMKNDGGMYHRSQIIKQPDVMVLFTYIHNNFSKSVYEKNWDYYEAMCEASSTLTFPVHSICAFDNNQLYKGYNYFMKSASVDLDDIQGVAKDGVHAACASGAWYSIVRGLAGIEMFGEYVAFNPKMLPWWNSVELNLCWHGVDFKVKIDNEGFEIIPKGEITIKYKGNISKISSAERFEFPQEF